jgi:hypothetical protein
MKVVIKSPHIVVVDDLLPEDKFENLWIHIQNEKYSSPHNTQQGWQKVWRLNDNNCLGGPNYYLNKKPFNNYMDAVSTYMINASKNFEETVGVQGLHWTNASFRPYIYQSGSKLSWHNDAGKYKAALTYYVHPYWGSTWGGELMYADVPKPEEIKEHNKSQPHLDHRWEDIYLSFKGKGGWILPKPNRLVLMTAGVYHSINRVDQNAGDNPRCSIVSFLMQE